MKESQFSRLVVQNIHKNFPGALPTKIEGSSATGIHDINICLGALEIWLELKILYGDKIGLRPSQMAWAMERSKQGSGASGRLFTLIRKADSLHLVKTLDLIQNDLSLRLTPKVFETSKPFNWKELFEKLKEISLESLVIFCKTQNINDI